MANTEEILDAISGMTVLELSELLKEFRGKVIISAANSALYKRLYGGWTRKGVPGRPKESLWLNF